MTFNSWEFILFYPIVLLLYVILPKRTKWPMLLFASYFFYMLYQVELVVLILGTTLISYFASHVIAKTESLFKKRLALTITLVSSLGVLFFFKYFNFITGTVFGLINLFGGEASFVALNIVLPVGISFYTFQTLSYVIDVYRKEFEPENNFFFYALFISFFPQLVAGPIERPGNLIPQLKEPRKFNKEDAVCGAKHMMLGFFKKICVADFLAGYVNVIFNNPKEADAFGIIIATLMFSVQIYCDFSGYTDIAIGCSRIMGIRLMKNFDRPYSSTSIKEFWSRWHISLSTWFKDYLYIPLGGNRVSRARHLFNLFFVSLVSGLWHGAAFTFVIWGALHGFYQIVGNLTYGPRKKLLKKLDIDEKSVAVLIIRRIITFALVAFAWIFFRANGLSDAILLVSKLFIFEGASLKQTLSYMDLDTTMIIYTVLSVILLYLLDRTVVYGDDGKSSAFVVKNGSFIYFCWLILLSWALLLSKDMISTFIYFRF